MLSIRTQLAKQGACTTTVILYLCFNLFCSLMEACYHGQLDCAKLLIAGGASWSTRDSAGMYFSFRCCFHSFLGLQVCQLCTGLLMVDSVRQWN